MDPRVTRPRPRARSGARRPAPAGVALRTAGWLALGLSLVGPGRAGAQVSEVASLWRELEVVRQAFRVEQAVLALDVDRYRAERVRRRFKRPMNPKGQEAQP